MIQSEYIANSNQPGKIRRNGNEKKILSKLKRALFCRPIASP
jgi:hypothetical protein